MKIILNYKLFCESLSEDEERDYFNSFSEDMHKRVSEYQKASESFGFKIDKF